MQAQVTIGSDIPPAKGAHLDLKMSEDKDGVVNSTKGLKISRVNLTSITSLAPLVLETESDYALHKKMPKVLLFLKVDN